jgi:hypothetical protein
VSKDASSVEVLFFDAVKLLRTINEFQNKKNAKIIESFYRYVGVAWNNFDTKCTLSASLSLFK